MVWNDIGIIWHDSRGSKPIYCSLYCSRSTIGLCRDLPPAMLLLPYQEDYAATV